MSIYKYAKLHRSTIPKEFIDAYNLEDLFDEDGYVYIEIRKGIYGLKQAGKLAHDQLKTFLEPHGYKPTLSKPGLWIHDTRKISFTLIVDDFGVKYEKDADAVHLMSILKNNYEKVTEDWTGGLYAGITLK